MSLDQFDKAQGVEGYIYELHQGVIEVTDVPRPEHFEQVQELRDQLTSHRLKNAGKIHAIAGSNECKLLIGTTGSERHPDLSIYLTARPRTPDVWSLWVPEIVIEVVSRSSAKRDYEEKPQEYLNLGITEYWIVDSFKNQMTANVRNRGLWKPQIVKTAQKYKTLRLPGFSLDLKKVFAAAK